MELDFTTDTRVFLGLYEIELNRHLRRFCLPGTRCYDVGARHGYDALVMAKLGGVVTSFEGDGDALSVLRTNLALNPDLSPRIAAVQAMVGDRDGDGFTRLDEWAGAPDHFPPELIKIDVDGGELAVLRGALKVLRRHTPHLIVETHSHELERSCGVLLADIGYRPRIVHQRAVLKELRPIEHNRWLVAAGRAAEPAARMEAGVDAGV